MRPGDVVQRVDGGPPGAMRGVVVGLRGDSARVRWPLGVIASPLVPVELLRVVGRRARAHGPIPLQVWQASIRTDCVDVGISFVHAATAARAKWLAVSWWVLEMDLIEARACRPVASAQARATLLYCSKVRSVCVEDLFLTPDKRAAIAGRECVICDDDWSTALHRFTGLTITSSDIDAARAELRRLTQPKGGHHAPTDA